MGLFDIIIIVAFGLTVSVSAGLAIKEAVKRHKENKARKNPPIHLIGETFDYDEYCSARQSQSVEIEVAPAKQTQSAKEEHVEQSTTRTVRRR